MPSHLSPEASYQFHLPSAYLYVATATPLSVTVNTTDDVSNDVDVVFSSFMLLASVKGLRPFPCLLLTLKSSC